LSPKKKSPQDFFLFKLTFLEFRIFHSKTINHCKDYKSSISAPIIKIAISAIHRNGHDDSFGCDRDWVARKIREKI
jgi:hypothetical protein